MSNDTIVAFRKPEEFEDTLTELLRSGARQLIAQAVEAELIEHAEQGDGQGRRAVVRNGYLPERTIQTGIGDVEVKVPRVRDRGGSGIKFNSALLPPYLRRSRSVETVLPWLYLKGVSTGEFQEALTALLGPQAKGLSPASISRLKSQWQLEHQQWSQRNPGNKRYVHLWADGVYFGIRADEAKQCIPVLIGVDEHGHKEPVAIEDGYRESERSWLELLPGLKARGLEHAAQLAIGDGALGFRKALSKVYGETRRQRCRVHKTANVLNKLPKSAQPKAKQALQEIYMAETRTLARKALATFVATYEAKYPNAAACPSKDRDTLLAFHDFPAMHWQHIRTTNPSNRPSPRCAYARQRREVASRVRASSPRSTSSG